MSSQNDQPVPCRRKPPCFCAKSRPTHPGRVSPRLRRLSSVPPRFTYAPRGALGPSRRAPALADAPLPISTYRHCPNVPHAVLTRLRHHLRASPPSPCPRQYRATSLPTRSDRPTCRALIVDVSRVMLIPSPRSHCPRAGLVPYCVPSPRPLFTVSGGPHTSRAASPTPSSSPAPLCMRFGPHPTHPAVPPSLGRAHSTPSRRITISACRPVPTMPPCCPHVLAPSRRFPSVCPAIFRCIYSSRLCLSRAPHPAVPFRSGCLHSSPCHCLHHCPPLFSHYVIIPTSKKSHLVTSSFGPIRLYHSVHHRAASIGFRHAHPQIHVGFVRWGVISFSFFLHQSLLGLG